MRQSISVGYRWVLVLPVAAGMLGGCGLFPAAQPAPLFEVPLSIEGKDVGGAIIDTGGGFEVLLKESFGLPVVESATVLAFGGLRVVELTGPFSYSADGLQARASAAIVDGAICACNGLGFGFLRKTGLVLGLDFVATKVEFVSRLPAEGILIAFADGPERLADFDAAFVDVMVESGGESRVVRALLDTGATATVMRRGLVGTPSGLVMGRQDVRIGHERLGTLALNVGLFDTPQLPDVILGTDVMRVWGDRWYFLFSVSGGAVLVVPGGAGVGGAGPGLTAEAFRKPIED